VFLCLQDKVRLQGVYKSLHRDIIVHFRNWDFDPMELKNPYHNNEASVHLLRGHEDKLVIYLFYHNNFMSYIQPFVKSYFHRLLGDNSNKRVN